MQQRLKDANHASVMVMVIQARICVMCQQDNVSAWISLWVHTVVCVSLDFKEIQSMWCRKNDDYINCMECFMEISTPKKNHISTYEKLL